MFRSGPLDILVVSWSIPDWEKGQVVFSMT